MTQKRTIIEHKEEGDETLASITLSSTASEDRKDVGCKNCYWIFPPSQEWPERHQSSPLDNPKPWGNLWGDEGVVSSALSRTLIEQIVHFLLCPPYIFPRPDSSDSPVLGSFNSLILNSTEDLGTYSFIALSASFPTSANSFSIIPGGPCTRVFELMLTQRKIPSSDSCFPKAVCPFRVMKFRQRAGNEELANWKF